MGTRMAAAASWALRLATAMPSSSAGRAGVAARRVRPTLASRLGRDPGERRPRGNPAGQTGWLAGFDDGERRSRFAPKRLRLNEIGR
ncbi:hypothetical protein THAOC_22981, partial [Thalassiosira oceanica]